MKFDFWGGDRGQKTGPSTERRFMVDEKQKTQALKYYRKCRSIAKALGKSPFARGRRSTLGSKRRQGTRQKRALRRLSGSWPPGSGAKARGSRKGGRRS